MQLNAELKKCKEELQTIRFSKVSGTAVSKLSKIKVIKINNFFKFYLNFTRMIFHLKKIDK